jgi:4-hydroxymandelate oxidase
MRLVNLADYESHAREVAGDATLDYYDGGANDEITLRENTAAFGRIAVYPRVLRGVGERDLSTTVLGIPVPTPTIVAPVALVGRFHADGEAPVARAASRAGSIVTLSTFSVTPVEDVVAAASGPVWFQLYIYRDRSASEALVRRVEAAGCSAIQLTVDTPVVGRRERDVRNDFALPKGLWAPNLTADGELPPALAADASGSPFAAALHQLVDPNLTWDDLAWLTSLTDLPVLVKGVLRADDAGRAMDAGAAGVVVSNHGGRQFDTAPAAIDALRPVVDAIGDRGEVLVDSGIRRGADILKAIAMGARAVQVGRPVVWGYVVDGEQGVTDVLTLLRNELDLAMALAGCRTVGEITFDLLGPG